MFSLKYSHLRQFLANLIETLHFYYYWCDKFDDEFCFFWKKKYLSMSYWHEKSLLKYVQVTMIWVSQIIILIYELK